MSETKKLENVEKTVHNDQPKRWLNRTVLGAGITSVLSDSCYETMTVILPEFLAVLSISAAVLGIIEGGVGQ